jgi:hypothetical protein
MTHKAVRTVLINLVVIALALPVLYCGAMEWMAWHIAERISRRGAPNTKAWLAGEGQGFNPANTYWVVNYDCREADVEIKGTVPKARYWSIVAYNKYTMPLDSYIFDETVKTDDTGGYTAYLTVKPRGRPNEIDVAASPRGLVLIRNSFPEDPDVVVKTVPEVRPLPRD